MKNRFDKKKGMARSGRARFNLHFKGFKAGFYKKPVDNFLFGNSWLQIKLGRIRSIYI
jgi:hypothetical protein